MIYLDSSVALAQLFGEGRSPPDGLWQEPLVSSRLLEYEVWNRVHARGFGLGLGASARALIGAPIIAEFLARINEARYRHRENPRQGTCQVQISRRSVSVPPRLPRD